MFLRQLRWIVASLAIVAGVFAAPAQSKADVQILVEELGGPTPNSQSTTLSGSGGFTFNGNFFTGVLVTVSTNSASAGATTASLTPSFSGTLTNAFDPALHSLRVTVSDNSFIPNGPTGTLKVQTSGSNGFASGVEAVASTTRIFNSGAATIAGPVSLSTPDGTLVKNDPGLAVSGLPTPYGIQQQITVTFSGSVTKNATFGATGGASVTSNSPPAGVPAPGGLVLGLIALPLLGLRRTLRKRAAA